MDIIVHPVQLLLSRNSLHKFKSNLNSWTLQNILSVKNILITNWGLWLFFFF